MSITFPINHPTTIGFESITLAAVDSTVVTTSPFSFEQQVLNWGGQRWDAEVSIPRIHRDLAAEWKAFLLSLSGQQGTFLLGDPDYATPRGTATSGNASGTEGDSEVTFASLNGTLLPGDYFQLGVGSLAKLYTVLETVSGSGTVAIWPNLRQDYSSESLILNEPKGVFRLTTRDRRYSIDSNSTYLMSFSATEAL